MSKERWNERCPHCGVRLCMYDHFVANDHETDFNMDCPLCDEPIAVRVVMVPEFAIRKPEQSVLVGDP